MLQVELDGTNKLNGVLVGDGGEFKSAKVWVFDQIKHKLPQGDQSDYMRTFGDVDVGELARLGLKEQDHIAALEWGQGIWLSKPNHEDEPDQDLTRTSRIMKTSWPPFIAEWAFIKRVTEVETVVEYVIREDDAVIETERSMPKQYQGPPRFLKETKSAAFVKHLRRTYPRQADAILKYLLNKYKEYEDHRDGLGVSGYSVIRKLWDKGKDREMTLEEMCKLLMSLNTH